MRLCRFVIGDSELVGFYEDDLIFPVDQAAEVHSTMTGDELDLPPISDPLDLLPPNGPYQRTATTLWNWLKKLDPEKRLDLSVDTQDVDLLIPILQPPKILLLAGNYAEHVAEQGGTAAERAETFPYVFMKPSSTLNTHRGTVLLPLVSPDHIDWECELGVVIGDFCKGVTEDEALDYVAGYTVVNDITDRKYRPNPDRKPRERDKHFDWLHGKWHDTFLPVGPCVLSSDGVDPQNLRIKLRVNGETKQDGTTADMVFPVAAVISFISQWITLEPGDLIATGTPKGVGNAKGTYLKNGDEIEAEIPGIGILANSVMHEEEYLKVMESDESDDMDGSEDADD